MPPPEEEPSNFVEILERIWWRLDQALDAASLAASARFYIAEALLAGTSTLVDHHESPRFIEGSLDVLAESCHQLGIRAVLCFGATERNDGRREARRGLEECRRFIVSNRRSLVRGVVGLHASFTVSDETIREAGDLCRELGTVLHVHVAEDRADVEDALRRGYRGPLERLLELGALPPGSILAHGVHLDRDQVRLAFDRGLWLVQNPRSNRGNRVGYPGALVASSRVALGTDGYPARMDEEAAVLAEEAAAHGEDERIVEDRITAGWRLVGEVFGGPFAPLAPGAMADVGVANGRASQLVVGGKLVVRDGELLTGDVEQIKTEAHAQAPSVWGRMKALA
jgi:cytosine/adenosine deaminase-related metal-dependent hydrolase